MVGANSRSFMDDTGVIQSERSVGSGMQAQRLTLGLSATSFLPELVTVKAVRYLPDATRGTGSGERAKVRLWVSETTRHEYFHRKDNGISSFSLAFVKWNECSEGEWVFARQ